MYEIFDNLLKINNVTAYRVAKDTGITYSILSEWKAGRSTPKADKLQKIADYFNVTVEYLIGKDTELEPETEAQKKVKVITRKVEEHLTKEESDQLVKLYEDTAEMFLKSKGISLDD
jgi:transcriptional regulator with XRE-family HTH domain